MSTLRVNTLQDTAGVERYTARAWVNFNGTGTVAIRAAGNVSSITDRGVGLYTVNFTTAMPDANYAITGSGRDGEGASVTIDNGFSPAVGSVAIRTLNPGVSTADTTFVSVAIFR